MFPGKDTCSLVINTKQACKEPPLVAGFDFGSVIDYGQKALNVLKSSGDAGIDVVKQGFIMYQALTKKDLTGVFLALNDGKRDINAIMDAIKTEFNIS